MDKVWKILQHYGVNSLLISLCQSMYENSVRLEQMEDILKQSS